VHDLNAHMILKPQRCGLHAGASSGLHHDFHDNLYILLRGRKRFRLYPPDQAKRMYTNGRIAKVHGNGRFVYADQASHTTPISL
jgi:Cupin-like domain